MECHRVMLSEVIVLTGDMTWREGRYNRGLELTGGVLISQTQMTCTEVESSEEIFNRAVPRSFYAPVGLERGEVSEAC